MKVVLLAGGLGTRLREETEVKPKPMVEVGGHPILWHIMKSYATQGHKDFILCLGYKGEIIKDFFRNYLWLTSDVTLRLGQTPSCKFHTHHDEEDWSVTLAETGENTFTAGRIKRIESYLGPEEDFFLTYGDGVGNVDVNRSLTFHREHGKTLTVTAVHPPGRFGEMRLTAGAQVAEFNEKPQVADGWISGGFFVASRKIFNYLPDDDTVAFEQEPLRRITADGELMAYHHTKFWQPMDTFAEFTYLNRLWSEGKAPWKIW